ncbi:PGPGW domain-containing protein [Aquisalimonas asiatica]|uniref:Putative transmembrane protein (PGPGW) n=1 Tax=Aquisalimonas asiatica TaxID=406100 RepID=A0A1H8V6N8_9GAMM|nr:PGPGW domain-containing protein [Aquisalimonas asiatica]SEP11130.1 Putative transmembrane protein (PGPGW) [Aquisalimonas asiatica]
MMDWLFGNPALMWWMAAGSLVMLVAGLVLVPVIVVRLPRRYFAHRQRRRERMLAPGHPVIRVSVLLVKNAVGAVLVMAGLVMLVLPGQGVLTILVGLSLLNFPGKYKLERWIVSRPAVFQSMNWLRRRYGRRPLVL